MSIFVGLSLVCSLYTSHFHYNFIVTTVYVFACLCVGPPFSNF
jgi:hypothetical protein